VNWWDGQERRAWLDDTNASIGNALRYYLGPAAAPVNALAQGAAWMTPGADMMDMVQSGGDLMASRDGWSAAQAGLGLGAATLGMAIPGTAKGVSEGVEGAVDGIRAYHGSPHDFDAFSLDKIGTGEGAQAYGHGLYFAEKEGVARSYRDALSKTIAAHFETGGKRLTPKQLEDMRNVSTKSASPAVQMLLAHNDTFSALKNGNKAKFSKLMDERLSYLDGQAETLAKRAEGYRTNPPVASTYTADQLDERAGFAKREAEELRSFVGGLGWNPAKKAGHMYEVRINADPDDFLDWDKPLSEHGSGAKERLAAMPEFSGRIDPDDPLVSGQHILSQFPKGADAASRLREAGIPGIRYLDQGSRAAGDGSRNYVVFDDKLVEILRKYGLLGAIGGGAMAGNALRSDEERF
jgi:hypothetical protein